MGSSGASYLPSGGGTVAGDLTVADGTTKAYRLRRSGAALDFDAGGADLYLSNFANGDFTGTQRTYFRLESGAQVAHLIGKVVVGGDGTAETYTLDPATGVVHVGAKNSLTNIRICGFKNSSGAPAAGTWVTGDLVLDSAGAWHLCTAGGTPGTWT